jgi:predicted O-methyltransferase YrrM
MGRIRLTSNLRSEFTSAEVERYLYALLPRRDVVLEEMERYAAGHSVPIVGPAVGRLLALLVRISGARRIFEMGSAIGYSTLWLARAAGASARVYYSDGDRAKAAFALERFRRAGVARRIRVLTGNSLDLIAGVRGKLDMVFIDVDKHQYPEALRRALPRLRRGGLLVADNALWSGRAARRAAPGDAATRGVREFNRLTFAGSPLFTVIVPLRDGVTIAVKT